MVEIHQAAATDTWNFIKTPARVWGVAIPAVIFANHASGQVGRRNGI